MCTFSFHPVKAITTGEGGAVTTNSDALAERAARASARTERCADPITAAGTTTSRRSATTTGSPTSRPRWERASSPSSSASSRAATRSRRATTTCSRRCRSNLPPAAPPGIPPRVPPVRGARTGAPRGVRRDARGRDRRAGALRADLQALAVRRHRPDRCRFPRDRARVRGPAVAADVSGTDRRRPGPRRRQR